MKTVDRRTLVAWSILLPHAASAPAFARQNGTPTARNDDELQWLEISPGVDLYYYFAETSYGSAYVLGELINTLDTDVDVPRVDLTFLDPDGNILGTQIFLPVMPVAPAGGRCPYQIVLTEVQLNSWDSIESLVYDSRSPLSCDNVLRLEDVVVEEQTAEQFRIAGKVRNESSIPQEGVIVYSLAYTSEGKFVGANPESILADIPPGKTANFSMFSLRPPGLTSSDANYELLLEVVAIHGGSVHC